MRAKCATLLHENPVFSKADFDTLDNLISLARPKEYPANSILTLEGDVWPYLFYVHKGKLVVMKESSEGRALSISEVKKGELFWGPAFFEDNLPNPVTLRFAVPSRLLLWTRDAILPILLKNGEITWELSRLMMDRMIMASDLISGLAFQPVAGRLANLLMSFTSEAEPGPISRTFTLDDMAMRIGSTREVVCRFLQNFAERGYISVTRTELEIMDREQLLLLAQKERMK